MFSMDIFNLDESIKDFINETNKDDLNAIVEEFKRGLFSIVLSKTKQFRKEYEMDPGLERILSLVDATSYSQTGENKQAAEIIRSMYEDSNKKSIDDLILYGNLAFMCDYKLTRKIMSDAVKQIENEQDFDRLKTAHAYLALGEAEEKLEKYVRAIKYYKKGLSFFRPEDRQMTLFLHYKLGALHSMINETDEAIDYLQKTIELANEDNIEIKMNSLVSIAKMYGSKDEYEKAFTYLKEVIPMFEGSSLANKLVHAEAYTEMAFNYFDQSQLDEAVPYYDKAIEIHLKLPQHSARELGMIYMQYAYCNEHKEQPDKVLAAKNYEKAIEQLEKGNDPALLENALADIIAFFASSGNNKKKRFYENKFVKLTNEKALNGA
jgi:tetratricopeptide (TPR) repeat protein